MKSTKIVFGISVLVSWALLTAVFIVGFQDMGAKQPGQPAALQGNSDPSQAVAGSSIILNAAEVAKHNSASDCWTIINGKVYDITKYVGAHPGGASTILEICGIDGTSLFDTMGTRNQPHSAFAASLHDSFYIGDLNQNVSQSSLANATAKIAAAPIPRGGGHEEDEPEDD